MTAVGHWVVFNLILLQYNELVACKDKLATSAVDSLCSNNGAAGPYDQAVDPNYIFLSNFTSF